MSAFTNRALLLGGIAFSLLLSPCFLFAQKQSGVTIVGTVIGFEVPEGGWPMEFENLKIFYVRVDRVEKGKLKEKNIRVAYSHNPSDNPLSILPDEMFEGKFQWRFELSKWDEFDSPVSVSRADGDWVDTKNIRTLKGRELGISGDNAEKEFRSVLTLKKCVPIKGFEKEAISMEDRGRIKGYWLSFENKSAYKKLNAIPSK